MLETHAKEIRDTNKDQWDRILLTAKAVKEYSHSHIEEESIAAFLAKVRWTSYLYGIVTDIS
jgi:SET and MYND domain-containing protein